MELPKPQTDLLHGHRHRTPELAEPVELSHSDVQLRHLTLERPGHDPLAQSFEAIHFRLHQAAPVIPAPLLPNPATQPLAGTQGFVA